MYNYVLGMYFCTLLCMYSVRVLDTAAQCSAVQCIAVLYCSVYQTHSTNQTPTTSHHSQPHQMPQVRSWMLPRLTLLPG